MTNIRIMIADNDSVEAQQLANALRRDPDIEVVSMVTTRETAIKLLTSSPDVLIVNPAILAGHTLSRFIHSIQAKSPGTRVLALFRTMPTDDQVIGDIRTGIRGYVRSSEGLEAITRAVRSIHGGEMWAERRILEKALANPMLLPETIQAHVPGLPPLTNKEMEVLTMVLQGASNKEIADSNHISERTVKTHLYRVYRKLNVKSRTKAIALLAHT